MTATPATLAADLARLVSEASPEELPRLIGELEQARAVAWSRLTAPASNGNGYHHEHAEPDLLTYEQAAKLLSCSQSYVETLVRQCKLPTVKLPATDKAGRHRDGRMVRLRRADVLALAQEQQP